MFDSTLTTHSALTREGTRFAGSRGSPQSQPHTGPVRAAANDHPSFECQTTRSDHIITWISMHEPGLRPAHRPAALPALVARPHLSRAADASRGGGLPGCWPP
eukprot:2253038-Pyramimonas_sp.AAC.1